MAPARSPVRLELNSVNGLYALGDTVKVYASLTEDCQTSLVMRINCLGKRIKSAKLPDLEVGAPFLIYSATFSEPAAVNVSVGDPNESRSFKSIGFAVAPEAFAPGFEEPGDLMDFWDGQKKALRTIPIQVKAVEADHPDKESFICYDLELSMPEGAPVRGYLAMPRQAANGTLPIVLLPHAAGVVKPHCHSSIDTAVNWAKKGVIALDINAHGFLNGQPQEYYDTLDATTLKDYAQKPLVSREDFYFRLMFLRLVRAMDYLAALPQWDGKRAVVIGESQGAAQAGAIAALDDRISMSVMNVPAMCDLGGVLSGRRGGWPAFYSKNVISPQYKDLSMAILPYYDVALLLKHTKASLVIECGLIDTTCPAECVFSAYNNATNAIAKTLLTCPWRPHHRVDKQYYNEWKIQVEDVRNALIEECLR